MIYVTNILIFVRLPVHLGVALLLKCIWYANFKDACRSFLDKPLITTSIHGDLGRLRVLVLLILLNNIFLINWPSVLGIRPNHSSCLILIKETMLVLFILSFHFFFFVYLRFRIRVSTLLFQTWLTFYQVSKAFGITGRW